MDKAGQFKSSRQDRNGTFTYDRREIEEFARQRGLNVKPSGELAARVFAMFKARKRFEDIVIETEQEPDAILELWRRYSAGFEYGRGPSAAEREEAHAEREHEEQMRALDLELERRRRGVLFADKLSER
ncbi:MAG: hypothetical protein KIS78_02630 [Labilithrix sp.]|nr:hypothetical protein [Labilithrix sp.]